MKKLLTIAAFAVSVTALSGCTLPEPSADRVMQQQQEQMNKEAVATVGMPAITNFQEKKLAKQIMELRDQENLVTYTYVISAQTGQYTYLGKSIGYGLPYATQFTSPEKAVDSVRYAQDNVLPQADPNGLFMPGSAAATWVMLVDESDGQPHPVYVESDVTVSPFKLPASVVSNY